ncbi:hypothetical protein L3V59_27200 [Burkholderia aenigmatica]|uniref:hypothetical protein n=1 Tax=Burkholderia aenigmatica TaxID=2015348 RepID=UPI001F267FAC|nr:hypothetical protein [Burkholderia aenigmatica]UKD13402.1 hypothetical protein L3V59_27200 [Burkholderia aenigmatica]
MSHGSCGMRAVRWRLHRAYGMYRVSGMIWHTNRLEEAIASWRNTRLPVSISNAQQTRLPRNENAGGNELKQSVTKRKSTVKPQLASLPILAQARKMKGLTTH